MTDIDTDTALVVITGVRLEKSNRPSDYIHKNRVQTLRARFLNALQHSSELISFEKDKDVLFFA